MPRHTTVLPGGASLARPQIASKPGDLDKVSQERWRLRGKRQVRDYALEQFYFRWGEGCLGGACGAHRLIIVSQNMRQLRCRIRRSCAWITVSCSAGYQLKRRRVTAG